MINKVPTSRQIENELSQRIRAFYQEQINFAPQKVTCKLFSKYLAIIAENAITPIESNLWKFGQTKLSERVRSEINTNLKPELSELIADTLNVEVIELLNGTAFPTNRCIILAILAQPPQISPRYNAVTRRSEPKEIFSALSSETIQDNGCAERTSEQL